MFTRNRWFRCCSNAFSFITLFTLFLQMIFAFAISFIAWSFVLFSCTTFQTVTKPPFPIMNRNSQ